VTAVKAVFFYYLLLAFPRPFMVCKACARVGGSKKTTAFTAMTAWQTARGGTPLMTKGGGGMKMLKQVAVETGVAVHLQNV
jgi:hypothetical protein